MQTGHCARPPSSESRWVAQRMKLQSLSVRRPVIIEGTLQTTCLLYQPFHESIGNSGECLNENSGHFKNMLRGKRSCTASKLYFTGTMGPQQRMTNQLLVPETCAASDQESCRISCCHSFNLLAPHHSGTKSCPPKVTNATLARYEYPKGMTWPRSPGVMSHSQPPCLNYST
jgi:hypothetical protein